MKNIMKELDKAVKILEQFSLSGKAVDMMAEAKRSIYIAKGIAKKYDEELSDAEPEAKEERDDG